MMLYELKDSCVTCKSGDLVTLFVGRENIFHPGELLATGDEGMGEDEVDDVPSLVLLVLPSL